MKNVELDFIVIQVKMPSVKSYKKYLICQVWVDKEKKNYTFNFLIFH